MNDTHEKVVVIGAGTMGHGIAQVAATAGHPTVIYDIDLSVVSKAMQRIRGNLDKGISLGKVSQRDRDDTLDRLRMSSELELTLQGAGIVIEAVPEQLELKRKIFRQIEQVVDTRALLASNTSSLSIGHMAADLKAPERFVGLHFFNPVHIMRLVEVVWGPKTSAETKQRGVDFARSLGKEPITVKDTPGFASSRLGLVLGLEAMRMVEQGVAAPEDIDRAMELGYRHPMGPLKLTDLVGLDVRLGIAEYLHEALRSDAFRPPDILKRLVAEGKLGKKSGEGFYTWEE